MDTQQEKKSLRLQRWLKTTVAGVGTFVVCMLTSRLVGIKDTGMVIGMSTIMGVAALVAVALLCGYNNEGHSRY